MAEENKDGTQPGTDGATDYKALWEKAQADLAASNKEVEHWKDMSRKNESRAKGNAQAAQDLEGANKQIADLTERLSSLEEANTKMQESVTRAERTELVAKVSKATGVPDAVVASLAANDEQGLTEAAKAIVEAYKTPGGAPAANEAGQHVSTGGQTDANANAAKLAELFQSQLGR